MTFKVASIVEGDGEVQALPVLLRRIAAWKTPQLAVDVQSPIRVRRDRFLSRVDDFDRYMHLAATKAGPSGGVLVVFDADDGCPVELARRVWSQGVVRGLGSSQVVVANREFEAWFAAAAESLSGCRGFAPGVAPPENPDGGRDAKGWIRRHTVRRDYSPVPDQAAFAARFDLEAAHLRSRSFRKLVKAWCELTAQPPVSAT